MPSWHSRYIDTEIVVELLQNAESNLIMWEFIGQCIDDMGDFCEYVTPKLFSWTTVRTRGSVAMKLPRQFVDSWQ